MQQLPTMLGPAVHCGKDTTHKTLETMCNARAWPRQTMLEELCKRIQHCCSTVQRSRNKRNVGSCWLKRLTGFKLCATTPNNMQQGVQTDATCNIQQCCARLYWALHLPFYRCHAILQFLLFLRLKQKLWLVRSIINTESSETGSLIKIHCKLWEIWEPNSPIFLNACLWTKLALLAFLIKLANFYKTLQVYHVQYDEPICENKCYYYYYYCHHHHH